MQICLLSAEYPPARGGVGDYTWHLAAALSRADLPCHVLTSTRPGATEQSPPNVSVHAEVTDWRFGGWQKIIASLCAEKPDILHIQYQTAAYGMHPAINLLPLHLRAVGVRPLIVTTFHDLRPPYLFPKAGPLRHVPATLLAIGSDAVVLVTGEHWHETPLAWQRRLRPSLEATTYAIPIGSNIPVSPPQAYDRCAWRAQLGVERNDLLLAYFGFLNRSKGVEDLLLAMRELREQGRPTRLLMVGGGGEDSNAADPHYRRQIDSLIAELDLQGTVRWTGFTRPEEVSANLLAADLCVLPFRDGATFQRGTLMAAIGHGLPVVSTWSQHSESDCHDHTSTHLPRRGRVAVPQPICEGEEVALRHGENVWLVQSGRPDSLVAAIVQLAADAALRERLRAGALRLAATVTWDAIAARHRRLYEDLVRRGK